MSRFFLQSLGCRLNQSEMEALARQLAARGHTVVDDPTLADICVVNTCAVTAEAERKTRHLLRALARANPQARLAVLGCAATLRKEELTSFPNVAWVIPNEEKERAAEVLTATSAASGGCPLPEVWPFSERGQENVQKPPLAAAKEQKENNLLFGSREWPETHAETPQAKRPESREGAVGVGVRARTRAFVKIQDGCDNACTYCIVHILRGPVRSRPVEEVVAEIAARVEEGYQEAVLTGVNIGAYGQDLGLTDGLARLVEAILSRTALPRLRLSSIEPWDVSPALLSLWSDRRLCRQLHLPLQSGCEATLRRMGRRMTAAAYARLVETARATIPDLAVTTDIIVGFPGESEEEFAESLAFVERMEFARLHVFPFSPRPGTPAARMSGQVSDPVLRERAARMRELGEALAARFRRQFLGREMEVLWERRRQDGLWHGLTDNYLQVVTSCPADLHNRLTRTRLAREENGFLVGEVI